MGLIVVHKKGIEKVDVGEVSDIAGAKVIINRFVTSKECKTLGAATISWLSGSMKWDYTYDEVLLVLDGEIEVRDRETGKVQTGQKGDIMFISNGTKVVLTGKGGFKGFYVTSPPTA